MSHVLLAQCKKTIQDVMIKIMDLFNGQWTARRRHWRIDGQYKKQIAYQWKHPELTPKTRESFEAELNKTVDISRSPTVRLCRSVGCLHHITQ
ncbi:Hypothetical protein PHPALM_900 [Phytophthora palmivora]|uniref:Uncharacterized protein n=1 Tax=Phytophthora palmivora TaxID=4796 RepID=A0A2P4YTR1_9STRA|nr:Hypothetical protein PHPALM_900 [Phytophthora palmivora]